MLPADCGFKYNPPSGGSADTQITSLIESKANVFQQQGLMDVQRATHAQALRAAATHRHVYLHTYVTDLCSVIDVDVIRDAKNRMASIRLGRRLALLGRDREVTSPGSVGGQRGGGFDVLLTPELYSSGSPS